ncbi:MAG: hypothetical protein ACRDAM_22525, partial [Casimicrobium sp.]
ATSATPPTTAVTVNRISIGGLGTDTPSDFAGIDYYGGVHVLDAPTPAEEQASADYFASLFF